MPDREPSPLVCLKCGDKAGHSNATCPNQTSEQRVAAVIKSNMTTPRDLVSRFESLVENEILTREEAVEFVRKTLNGNIDGSMEGIRKNGLSIDSGISSRPDPGANIKLYRDHINNYIDVATVAGILDEIQPKIDEFRALIKRAAPGAERYL
ncbi:MAG TPA: hypothetical protein DEB09_05905 [Candidatus Magasanikbacteria bacterium]|nr:hypothetical protein [Candidatus Magasanikbacteria bacterium]